MTVPATKPGPKTTGAVIGAGVAAVLLLASPLIARWEGVRYTAYQDVVGVWTVCYGHTKNVDRTKKYTKAECLALLDLDMAEANVHVRRCLPMPMFRHVEAALTDLVFNVGPRGVCGSTLQKRALANNWPGACAALDMWVYAGGRVYPGLKNRRTDARYLCETGKYRWIEPE